MSSVHRLPTAPVVRLAPPPADPPRWPVRRRAAAGALVAAALAAPAVILGIGKLGPVPAASPVQGSPSPATAASPSHPQAPSRDVAGPSRTKRPERVVLPRRAGSLFAPHSWYVPPPPPPVAPPPPPPEPTAPPLPFTFVGSYAPGGEAPVYFLSRGDRMIDARVGDRIDGIYQFESAAAGQLVFVYLPLKVRQFLAAGAPQ